LDFLSILNNDHKTSELTGMRSIEKEKERIRKLYDELKDIGASRGIKLINRVIMVKKDNLLKRLSHNSSKEGKSQK
jgi:hypothetical protein